MQAADRLAHIKEYYFSTKLKAIAQRVANGENIINLGIGSPDLPPPDEVISELQKTVSAIDIHSYQSYRGLAELRRAIQAFYQNHYQVKLNADTEILPLIGSKEGIMHISMAFVNHGDKVLVPNPGYMTYTSATKLAGGLPIYYNLQAENRWLPDLKSIEKQDLSKVKLMWLNYPNMPTGASISMEEYQEIITFAKKHNILVVNDNPYSFILGKQTLSILQSEESMAVAMELNSLSKSHHMAGWRVGMLLGSQKHIDQVMKFKSNMDSGMFYGIQKAAVKALEIDQDWYKKLNKIYSSRKEIVLTIAKKLGLEAEADQQGMFVWCKLPKGQKSASFTDALLDKHHIFIAPGFIFGSNGDDYVRISLTQNCNTLKEALQRIENQ